MSEDTYEDDDTDEVESDSQVMKQLRRQAREGSAASKELGALRRELAFSKAGVPETKATGYFVTAYDGELDTESIRAAATEAGFITEDEDEDKDDAVTDDERQAHDRVQDAATGADDVEPPGYAEDVESAKTEAELLAVLEKHGKKIFQR